MRLRIVLLTIPMLLCFSTPLLATPSPTVAMALLDSISRAPVGREREMMFYRLKEKLDRGEASFATAEQSARLARVMSKIMLSETVGVMPWQAAAMMALYPHPAATPALLTVAGRTNPRSGLARSSALQALVSLHEPRAYTLLLADLKRIPGSGNLSSIRLMAELGDRRGLADLRRLAADPTLDDSCIAWSERRKSPAAGRREIALGEAASIRKAARRGERDLRRLLDHRVTSAFELDDSTWASINEHGFAIGRNTHNEMYEFLDEQYPCVTSDLVFHAYAVLARAALGEADSLIIAPRLRTFTEGMRKACVARARRSRDPATRKAAIRDAQYFAVAEALLRDGQGVGSGLPFWEWLAVRAEVQKIRSHTGAGSSLLPGGREDFTKYVARGRFSGSAKTKGYFQAVVWLGRVLMPVSRDEHLRQALVMADVLRGDAGLHSQWSGLDRLLQAFYGQPDDVRLSEVVAVLDRQRGKSIGDASVLASARAQLGRTHPPRIHTRIDPNGLGGDSRGVAVGILGQRYTRWAHLIQAQMDAGVWPPLGVTIPASLLGSARARTLLPDRLRLIVDANPIAAPIPPADADFPESALGVLSTLFRVPDRAPPFMKRPAWEDKQINTALGAWTEVVSITAPFAKDANMYASSSIMLDRFHGWVEPIPEFYSRLDASIRTLTRRLEEAGVFRAVAASRERSLASLPEPDPKRANEWTMEDRKRMDDRREAQIRVTKDLFDRLSQMTQHFEQLAVKELKGEPQTVEDGVFLKSLRQRFKYLVFNRSNSDDAAEPMALVTDPASEYLRGECWVIGVGLPHALYVAVPDGDRTFVCLGAVYSHYEFTQPIAHRLDNRSWRQTLAARDAPAPWWNTHPDLRPRGSGAVASRD